MTSELIKRSISAVVLVAIALALTRWSIASFNAMCILGAAIVFYEWWGLTKHRSRWWLLVGVLYIGGALACLLFLRSFYFWSVIYLFALVWSGDMAAYLVGRRIGTHKIAPSISPGKSWEGLAASMVTSAVVSYYMLEYISPFNTLVSAAIIGVSFSVVGLAGDMFESYLKRHAGVKDSGNLIPGHGGLFDRVDALLPCAMLLVGWLYFLFLQMH